MSESRDVASYVLAHDSSKSCRELVTTLDKRSKDLRDSLSTSALEYMRDHKTNCIFLGTRMNHENKETNVFLRLEEGKSDLDTLTPNAVFETISNVGPKERNLTMSNDTESSITHGVIKMMVNRKARHEAAERKAAKEELTRIDEEEAEGVKKKDKAKGKGIGHRGKRAKVSLSPTKTKVTRKSRSKKAATPPTSPKKRKKR